MMLLTMCIGAAVLLVVCCCVMRAAYRPRPFPHYKSRVAALSSRADLLSTLRAAHESGALVLIDAYATWCPPCRAAAPEFAKLSLQYPPGGRILFAKVDVDEARDVAAVLGVSVLPTFLLLRPNAIAGCPIDHGGQPADMVAPPIRGFHRDRLHALLEEHVGAPELPEPVDIELAETPGGERDGLLKCDDECCRREGKR